MEIIWLPTAQKHIEQIYNWQAHKSLQAANRLWNEILNTVELLKEFPQMAGSEPLLSSLPLVFRSLVVRNYYKVVYYTKNNQIYIAAIWDCRRNPQTHKKL